ncbi:MAG: alanine racemase [Syntrophomonadaceae bacterium]|nr:alanine racemase [Syntrophomonadaceae bacterium]
MQQLANDRWIEIDIDAVKNNLDAVKSLLDDQVRLIAVLKADAYGHGAAEIGRQLFQNGVEFFAVTFLEEALNLRQAGIRASIMLFSPIISEDQLEEAITNHITLTVSSIYDGQLVDKVTRRINSNATIHIKVDTGLGRFGANKEETMEICNILRENSYIYIEGIYTHMAEGAADKASYTEMQFARFMETVKDLEQAGINIPVKHCANSAVFLKYPHMHLNAVRIGTLLSGQHPVGQFTHHLPLVDPFKFKSRIISLRTLEAGSYLGYYRTYRLKHKAQIAVIPVGFNDGLALGVSNRPLGFVDFLKIVAKYILKYMNVARLNLAVTIKGHTYPVRGKVFMQLALIEIPEGVDIQVGDEVEVPVKKTLAAKSLVHVYMKDGKPVKIDDRERTTYIVEEANE